MEDSITHSSQRSAGAFVPLPPPPKKKKERRNSLDIIPFSFPTSICIKPIKNANGVKNFIFTEDLEIFFLFLIFSRFLFSFILITKSCLNVGQRKLGEFPLVSSYWDKDFALQVKIKQSLFIRDCIVVVKFLQKTTS